MREQGFICGRCGGSTKGQDVISGLSVYGHRHYPDCIRHLKAIIQAQQAYIEHLRAQVPTQQSEAA